MRRRRHQEQVARVLAQAFREPEASGLFELRAEVVRRELVGLVEDGEVPSGVAELFLKLLVPRHLVETNDELMVVVERVPARRGRFEQRRVDAEFEPELLEELVSPLIDETSRGDDQDASGVGPHDEFADVEPRHDRLPGPRVVRQNEPQRLPRQHRLIDGRDLVRQRLHVRRVDRHHRVKEKRKVDALRFAGQLEGRTVTVEGPRAFNGRDADARFISPAEKPLFRGAIRSAVEDLNGALADRHDSGHRRHDRRFQADERQSRFEGFEFQHVTYM